MGTTLVILLIVIALTLLSLDVYAETVHEKTTMEFLKDLFKRTK